MSTIQATVGSVEASPLILVLEDARRSVYGDRNEQYGPAEDSFARIGKIWGALLDRDPIPPRTVALMMAGLKIARDIYKPKHDNMVDVAGYAELAERLRYDAPSDREG